VAKEGDAIREERLQLEATLSPGDIQLGADDGAQDLGEGDGEKPTAEDRVQVHYTGELISGEVFDSSRERGEPVTFGLNQVIPGWTEGLQLMSEGSRAKLYIPSELAYGPGGNQRIGPNETLVFDVELLEINPE